MTDEGRDARTNPLDYLLILRRRIRWAVIPTFAVLVLGTVVTFSLPVKYRSSAMIAITGGSLSSDLAHPMGRDERARAIAQHLFEAGLLSRVARLEHLTRATPTEGDLVALRDRIQISVPAPVPGTDPGQADMYVISYSDSTAERARRVAQRLAEVFVDETSKQRQFRLDESSDFLAGQMRDTRAQMDRVEAKLTEAKAKNIGRLPEQSNGNMQMMQSLRQQLDFNAAQIQGEQDRLDAANREVAMLEQQPVLPGTQGPSTAQQRVRLLEQKLAADRLRYTENYPDVRDDKDELARAKKEAAAEAALPLEERQAVLSENPAYRQAVEARKGIQLRIRDLKRQADVYAQQMRGLQGRLESAPLVEQEIEGLQQDRARLAKQYEDLAAKLQSAQMQEETERRRGSEHFRVLYPAMLPSAPYEPNRQRLLLLTVGAALLAGVGGAVGREYLDQSIHDARALRQFDVPILGEIPHIDKAA